MNKQAITFLSLFSLILVLSVYYVMLPPVNSDNQDIVVSETTSDTDSEDPSTKQEENDMEKDLEEKREEEIQKQEDVISSDTSTNDDISSALEAIDETKALQKEEESVTKALNDAGYGSVFVEINNQTIKVTITKKDATNDDAVIAMNTVMQTTSGKYSPEIKFVNE